MVDELKPTVPDKWKEFAARAMKFIETAPVASGVCCCGDTMENHASAMCCGHVPVDQWDHAVSGLKIAFEQIDAAAPTPPVAPTSNKIIEALWAIIDDIDTYGDMAKGDDKAFRELVERRQKDRWKTGVTTDGYALSIPGTQVSEEAEALRKDAERYRWLIEQESGDVLYEILTGQYKNKEEISVTIDAAMKEKP